MFRDASLMTLLVLVLLGCDGGGSGNADGGITGDSHDVDQRAFEAAVAVALSETTVFCEEVFCPFADASTPVTHGAAHQHVCQWACISVIDDHGEWRQYYIGLIWDRLEPACFNEAEVEVWVAGEHAFSCDPHA